MQLIDNIIKLRKENHESQRTMAELLNTTQNQYWKYENEKQELPIRHLITIAEHFNVSTDYLLGRKQNETRLTDEILNIIEMYKTLSEKRKGKAERYLEQLNEEQDEENAKRQETA